jgi:LVIVD repeat
MTLSGDGNRAYVADPKGNMLILDTSEIQARKPDPKAREISRLTWASASIPQNAIPFTENGKPYLLEFDEYTQGTLSPTGDRDAVGAGRIIDISDEQQPRVISNLRLEINQPAEHHAATVAGDPGTGNPAQGYAAHYCNIPTTVDPKVVACSFIASGLRVFDISDLVHPKEVGYFVAPPSPRSENGYMASDFAMSKPAFLPERREIWYSDGTSGFYVLRVAKDVWP